MRHRWMSVRGRARAERERTSEGKGGAASAQFRLDQGDELTNVSDVRELGALEADAKLSLARKDQQHVCDRIPPFYISGRCSLA